MGSNFEGCTSPLAPTTSILFPSISVWSWQTPKDDLAAWLKWKKNHPACKCLYCGILYCVEFHISIPAVGLPASQEPLPILKVSLSMNFSRIQPVSQKQSFQQIRSTQYAVAGICGVWCCTEKCDPKELHLSQTLEGCVVGCFLGCLLVFYSPQMSNNFLCEQVGAANFVAPWSTSKKTARRNRMQVSCRGCGLGVGPAVVSYCSA